MTSQSPVAIVTGAGSGIGRQIGVQLSNLGWSLVLVGRTEATLRETAAECPEATEIVLADVGDPAAPAEIAERTRSRFGRLDGLVNNAGLALMKPFAEYEDDELERTFAVNAIGPLKLILRCWPLLVGGGGRVVNVTSMATIDPFPGLGTYGAAKTVLNLIGLTIGREHPAAGVLVFAVAPGAVETGMLRAIVPESALPTEKTLDPAFVASVIVDCVTGERDNDAGRVITLPSPSA